MKLDQLSEQVFSSLPIRKKTLATYRSMYRCHIQGKLGALEINEINRSDIKSLIFGLPPQTAAMTLAVIKVLFREALELEYTEKSPAHGIRGPKVMVRPRNFLTWDELEKTNLLCIFTKINFL